MRPLTELTPASDTVGTQTIIIIIIIIIILPAEKKHAVKNGFELQVMCLVLLT